MTQEFSIDKRYESRKFRFAVAVWLVGSVAWLTASFGWWAFTTDQWILFSQWVLGLYVAGNVGDTIGESLRK
jgi:hypothetical protein